MVRTLSRRDPGGGKTGVGLLLPGALVGGGMVLRDFDCFWGDRREEGLTMSRVGDVEAAVEKGCVLINGGTVMNRLGE